MATLDEFPERADNPPLTVDVFFLYEGNGNQITTFSIRSTGLQSKALASFKTVSA